tara:strand:- start:7933 stop:10497 length:2565 start_codon:yes stop_codon:yes gene_type:complete
MAEDDFGKKIENLEQQKKLLDWMVGNQKKLNNGISSYLKAKKELFEYTELMVIAEKNIAEEIKVVAELEKDKTVEGKKQLKDATKRLKDQQKTRDTLNDELNLLKKAVNLRRAATNELEKGVKWLNQELFTVRKLVNLYLEMDKAIRTSSTSMGLTSGLAQGFKNNMMGAAFEAARVGVSLSEIARAQSDLSESTGRQTLMSKEEMERLSKAVKILPEIGQYMGSLELFGMSPKKTSKFFNEIHNTATSIGLNATKLQKDVGKNLKMMAKYRFKNMEKDLMKVISMTQDLRTDFGAIAAFAEKVFRPEGAIEAAASLQVLGGAMGRLGDPFMLMSKARNDMAGFTEEVLRATKFTGKFDKRTGVFTHTANELDRLRELSKITGQSMDDLVSQSLEQVKGDKAKSQIRSFVSPEDKDFLSNIAKHTGKGVFEVEYKGQQVNLSRVTPEMIKHLKNTRLTDEQRAQGMMTIMDKIKAIGDMLQISLMPWLDKLAIKLDGWVQKAQNWSAKMIKDWAVGILSTAALFSVAAMFSAGISMGLGFRSASGVGSLATSVASGGGGAMNQGSRALSSAGVGLKAARGSLMKMAGVATIIAAIGASVMMIGKGVQLATDGFANMATAMSSLPLTHLAAFESVVNSILIGFGSFVVIIGGLAFALATSAVVLAPVQPILLSVGAAMLMMGAGIGIAAAGMSLLITSINEGKDVGITLMAVAAGMGGLLLATTAFANPLTAIGLASAMLSLYGISKMGPALSQAGVGIKMVSDNLLTLKTNLKAFGDGSGLSDVVGSLKELQNITQTAPIRVEVGGEVGGSVFLESKGGGLKKEILTDSSFLSDLTDKIEAVIVQRDGISGVKK